MLAFARQQLKLVDDIDPSMERRSAVRLPFALPAVLQTVDSDLRPLDDPIAAVTRDMTADGVGLVLGRNVDVGETVAVQFSVGEQELCLLGELLWCEPAGPFQIAGVRIVRKLASMP